MKLYFFCLFICPILFACTSCKKTTATPAALSTPVLADKPVQVQEAAFAFPGAEGFGKDATGGRDGRVIFVTNLNDGGEGSFRAAVTATGKRYILFKISGTITLSSALIIKNGDLTIAGQTAPGDGICIKNYPITIDADNVIIRFLRFRMGDEMKQEGDAFGGRFHKNIIIDHCSMSWSTDECVSFYANENFTLQWCIISESLRNSVHGKGAHGYGGIWGGRKASFHHNLLAHNDSRNPRLGEEAGKAFALTDLVDLRNNVIYNWGGNSTYGGEGMNVNIVNCYYKPGPATAKTERIVSIDKNKIAGTEVYNHWGKFFIGGNFVEGSTRATADNWSYGVYNQFHNSYGTVPDNEKAAMRATEPHPINNNTTTHTAQDAYQRVLLYGGASLARDAVDARVVQNVAAKSFTAQGSNGSTNGIIDSQKDVGGWPQLNSSPSPLTTSGDGIPDEWKESKKLKKDQAQANGRDLSTAYDNIEVYINSLVSKITDLQNK
ncbi:MAG TPA: hypothetical protein VM935_13045 [Chitinophagaceae bacterium]|nr:hypothetical protein [Chitinophagaceae bacterium]